MPLQSLLLLLVKPQKTKAISLFFLVSLSIRTTRTTAFAAIGQTHSFSSTTSAATTTTTSVNNSMPTKRSSEDAAVSPDKQNAETNKKQEVMVARRSWEDELKSGNFERSKSSFQSVVSDASETYKPETGRYHFYLAKACPWANRLEMLTRMLGMTEHFPITFVDPVFAEIGDGRTGWVFTKDFPDDLTNKDNLYQVYLKYHPDYEGKATTPMLLDTKTGTIVSNESRDMLKSLCWGCKDLHADGVPDLYPHDKEALIDEWIDKMYDPLLNGVYKVGFTTDQATYDKQIEEMFDLLDEIDIHLGKNKWMLGEKFSVLDFVIGVTLTRFDAVYYVHFMCCKKHIYDYEHLGNYVRAFYQLPDVKAATDLEQCKMHYFKSHHVIAPHKLIAASNVKADLNLPHNRDELFPEKKD